MKPESDAGEKFQKLTVDMAGLPGPDGCPWDREQTFDSIKPFTLEETYEVLDAIDHRDWAELAQELGDFMLQAVFYAQMASEQQLFRVKDAEPKAERKKATGLLGGVPRALPALVEAQQIASKAAGVGFDWENPDQ